MIYVKPPLKPQANLTEISARLTQSQRDVVSAEPVCLIGIRGYYANTFGKPHVNDRIHFDDALFIVTQTGVEPFNFNSDPSVYLRGVATLKSDEVYTCVKWKHKGKYPALQIVLDKVYRDGSNVLDIGRHGINFHYDAEEQSKYSLGCQTLPRSQWAHFIDAVYTLMDKDKIKNIKYILVD